jgi:hypothetical protein
VAFHLENRKRAANAAMLLPVQYLATLIIHQLAEIRYLHSDFVGFPQLFGRLSFVCFVLTVKETPHKPSDSISQQSARA